MVKKRVIYNICVSYLLAGYLMHIKNTNVRRDAEKKKKNEQRRRKVVYSNCISLPYDLYI